MSENSNTTLQKNGDEFTRAVGYKAKRKLKAQRHSTQGLWLGLGMMGLIGWSVVVPTLIGAALGIWVDKNYPTAISWTLALLIAGLSIGCLNSWFWVSKEDKAMREEDSSE